MTDILDRLKAWAACGISESADLDDCINGAVAEIEYLRWLTGPVSRGGDFADIAAGVLAAKPKLPEVS